MNRPASRETPVAPLAPPAQGEQLEDYLSHLAHTRRLSPLTVENYRRDLRDLLRVTGERPLESLKAHDLRRAVARLHAEGLSGRSLARKLSAWRGMFGWLGREGVLPSNPAAGLKAPRAPRKLPACLSPDQAARLLDGEAHGDEALCDQALFELIYSSGLRLAEAAGLDPADVDLREGTVRVTGKGAKTRVVPLGAKAAAALEAWLPARERRAAPDETALFLGVRGRRIAHRAVQKRLDALALERGLDAHVHPHVLRHSFASHVLQSSGDLRAVQELLGHASISTTQVYTHLDFQHLARVYDAAHPRARRK